MDRLEKALTLSLDDYIAEKGIVSSLRPKPAALKDPGYFKRPLQSEMDDDENEDDMLFIEDRSGMDMEEDGSQAPETDPDLPPLVQKTFSRNDENSSQAGSSQENPKQLSVQVDSGSEIRTFVTEEQKQGIKNMPSQQWRLNRKNQVSSKPNGVPPLMSVKAVFDRNTERLIASLGENAKFRNDDARKRINERLGNSRYHNNRNNNNWNNNGGFNRNRNNWNRRNNDRNRNQNGGNMNMMPSFNPTADRQEFRNKAQMNKNNIRDLRPYISPPSSFQGGLLPNPYDNPQNRFGQQGLVTFADMLNRIGQVSTVQDRESFVDVVRNMMRNQQQDFRPPMAVNQPMMPGAMSNMLSRPDAVSQMSPNELMPVAATMLLNHISTVQQNFGPKYDMKVQKDIHTLQGKTMMYRQHGVVSMDGPGIEAEKVTPTTTDLSMNMRFS
ncbi:putative uncharacterized protein DDB_G0286901 [Uranotaenia lowii]|uniref:putative uncharacterized protein DDB_G0286901 n=1 Tax=Uranotaenia lowii TaxID=190385 RepID=UPI002479F66D|nr:putative uncharacterized protein DDB_G0286901 [Uranotaenia lowii]